jgi:hypothetical protein
MYQTTVMFGGMKWNLLRTVLLCTNPVALVAVHVMTVATESKNVGIKFEDVHAKLIVYGHWVCTLVNPYFKLWAPLRESTVRPQL